MPVDEWKANLHTVAGEFDRADYHLVRFGWSLDVLKARRKIAGGPVFGDPGPARAVYCEAASYLSAVRTAIDILVYMAARRAGASVSTAERWKATNAITPIPAPSVPTKYDTDDIKALRRHKAWFETLNLYRNSMLHRGWHEQSFGYFEPADTAPEADSPVHNVMLIPDQALLKQGARPDTWTYADRRRLDALVHEIDSGAAAALNDLLNVWNIPTPAAGRIPIADQPTVFLTVPFVPPIQGQVPPVLHVFLSKTAARLFLQHFKKYNVELAGCSFRALRRTTLQGEGAGYVIAYDAQSLGSAAELQLIDVHLGRVRVVQTHAFRPGDRNGPVNQTLWFRLPTVDTDPLYVLTYVG